VKVVRCFALGVSVTSAYRCSCRFQLCLWFSGFMGSN